MKYSVSICRNNGHESSVETEELNVAMEIAFNQILLGCLVEIVSLVTGEIIMSYSKHRGLEIFSEVLLVRKEFEMTTAGKIITGFVALLFTAGVAVIGAIVGIAICEKMYILLTIIPFGILSMFVSGKILFDIFKTYIDGIRSED